MRTAFKLAQIAGALLMIAGVAACGNKDQYLHAIGPLWLGGIVLYAVGGIAQWLMGPERPRVQ